MHFLYLWSYLGAWGFVATPLILSYAYPPGTLIIGVVWQIFYRVFLEPLNGCGELLLIKRIDCRQLFYIILSRNWVNALPYSDKNNNRKPESAVILLSYFAQIKSSRSIIVPWRSYENYTEIKLRLAPRPRRYAIFPSSATARSIVIRSYDTVINNVLSKN